MKKENNKLKFENNLSLNDECVYSRSKTTLTSKKNKLVYIIGMYIFYQSETGDYDVIKAPNMNRFAEYGESALSTDFEQTNDLPKMVIEIFSHLQTLKKIKLDVISCSKSRNDNEFFNYIIYDKDKNTYISVETIDKSKIEQLKEKIPYNKGSIEKPIQL